MALLWSEGFEHYGIGANSAVRNRMLSGLWSELGGSLTGTYTTPTPRTGGVCFRAYGGNGSDNRRVIQPGSTRGVGYGIFLDQLPSADNQIAFSMRDGANNSIITTVVQSTGAVVLKKGSHTGTVLDSGSRNVVAGSWEHLEVVATISTTVGAVEVRLNGDTIIAVDSLNLGSSVIEQIAWSGETFNTSQHYLDDIVAHTGEDFAGPARVITVYPASDGSPFDWSVVGAVAGYQAVNETTPDDDTSYVQAADVADVAEFGMPELPSDVISLVGVYIPARTRQSAAGVASIQASMHSGGASVSGVDHPVTEAYTYLADAFNVDPNTTGAWSKAAFEAATLRLTRTT